MNILRTEVKDYGGVAVFTDADDTAIHLAPHLLKTHWDGKALTEAGVKFVDDVLVARAASAVAAAHEAKWAAQSARAAAAIEAKRQASGDTSTWTDQQIEDAAKDALQDGFDIQAARTA